MRKRWKNILLTLIITVLLITGCSSSNQNAGTKETAGNGSIENSTTENTTTENEVTTSTIADSKVEVDTEFTANDLDVGYEDSTATHITFEGNSAEVNGEGAACQEGVLTISKEGAYSITGTLTDGQVVVDVNETDKVHLILNGAIITNKNGPVIYIKSADKTFLTLKEGTENTLTDGKEYIQTDDADVDGVIFSKSDLTINGNGILNINGNYKHGIASKDDLIITGGTYNITAVKDTLNGKDCVKIKDGTFTLASDTGNGIQSKNNDDETKGYVYICGGDITITKSQEGIEGTAIIIEDGNINLTAEDDGLNSSSGSNDTAENGATTVTASNATADATTDTETDTAIDATSGATTDIGANKTAKGMDGQERPGKEFGGGGGAFENDTNCYISIKGGSINVNASGDGIDSNGSVYISGSTTYVNGPSNNGNGGLDYNGTAEITGGTILITGSSGMAQGFSDTSSQYSILYNLSSPCDAGTEVKLTDKDGNVVISYTPDKQYQSIVISSPDLVKGETYNLISGEQSEEITLSSMVSGNGQQGSGQMGMPGKGGFGIKPERPGMIDSGADNSLEESNTTESN